VVPSWNLRKYRHGDEQEIVELLNTAFAPTRGKWAGLEHWKWKYRKNPAGSPIIWVAEHNNKIIGHYSIIPIRMKVGNTYLTGSFAAVAATHPKYQGKGVFSSVANRCYLDAAENGIPITYGFANVNLGPTYKRYEWRGHISFMDSMMEVLNWEPLLSKYIHSKILTRAGAYMLRKMCGSGPANGSLKIERISSFDGRIDRFWEEISKHFRIIVKRDQRYLNYRYVGDPENEYIIYTAVEGDRILGYCVLTETLHENLRTGSIVDILGFQDGCNAVSCLIQRALKCFKEDDIDLVTCEMSEENPYKAAFRKAGFIRHPRRKRAICATINLPGSSIDDRAAYSQALILSQNPFLKEKRNWFMMSGDGD